jgi:signal transduction histidine kinase/HAMP domain-containing protein
MASNLTKQVRGIVKVVTAVADGDLSQKFVLEAKGEVAALADTINSMTDTLRIFADQVTTVAREVGIEGKLGGQAKVPGAAGTWKDLTDNVNQLAGNLTTQVRAIAEVATAVTKGDLTQSIKVEAQGEVAELKDNINQMIANLKDTTRKNNEQDWLKTNLARFSSMMQGQRSIVSIAQMIMSELTPLVSAQCGSFFMMEGEKDEPILKLVATYAFRERKGLSNSFHVKEGLVGQCAYEKKRILIINVPSDYIYINSSLGESRPLNIVVLPVLFEGEVKAIIELASFHLFSENHLTFLDQLMDSLGVVLNMLSSTTRTEELLQELKRSNVELEAQANELEDKAKLLEVKNQEVELARGSLEEKAEQLQLISKYKSEFLANMSHELRTPLNSLLILSKLLSENKFGNLSEEQVKFASTIHSSGTDLLSLINEILDLSKVEAGKMPVNAKEVSIADVQDYLERSFRPVAEHKSLEFEVHLSANIPRSIVTDIGRLNQILRNLLSNAFKFTSKGSVIVDITRAPRTKRFDNDMLISSDCVLAFSVRDTGIGIPKEKQKLVFEAFQQADGTTSRKYGGTGLGLTISREIARLLGGVIEVESQHNNGSTFTLYLPLRYKGEISIIDQISEEIATVSNLDVPETFDFSGYKILIADDDQRNIFAIRTILEDKGMSVVRAENGREALAELERNSDIDLILMDVMMPEMDGFEAIQLIRQNKTFEDLPIISLTAKAMQGDRETCLAAGASDYITKPVDAHKLLAMIYLWLNTPASYIVTGR